MGTPIPLLINRKETGIVLATRLQQFQDHPQTLVVLALPRGGVPVVFMISRKLRLPLDVFLTRKLRYPGNPEYAIGAITETGYTWFNPDSLKMGFIGLFRGLTLIYHFSLEQEASDGKQRTVPALAGDE
jgi:hypothetical protein